MGKTDVWQGTLALMILKTLETLGPQHGYGIARRIEQTSGHKLLVNYGTLYPALLKLEQEGYLKSSWGVSDNNRKAKFYQLTLAVGANVSIFAVGERVVMNALPYPGPDRLLMLDFSMPSRNIPAGFNSITAREYFHYADNAHTLSAIAVYRGDDRTITGQGTPEAIRVVRTTPSLASVLRVAPMTGGWLPDGPR